MFDKELTRQQIQNLNNAEGVTAFFAYLGYDTNNRVPQTPANLGITAETIQRQIKRIERIADQQGLLSVYLVEMTSVSVAGIQGILRPPNSFRAMQTRSQRRFFLFRGSIS